MTLRVELEEEAAHRWIAEVPELPGVMTYAATPAEAAGRALALALRVLGEQLHHRERTLSLPRPLVVGGPIARVSPVRYR